MTAFVVTTTDDVIANDGKVSLREAIQAANTNLAVGDAPAGTSGLDTIEFQSGLNGTITLGALGILEISDDLTIDASKNSNTIIVSALASGHGVFATAGPNPGSGTTSVLLNGFTIDHGEAQGTDGSDGGGGSSGTGEGGGGGGGGGAGLGGGLFVGADSAVTLVGMTFDQNSASGGAGGDGGSAFTSGFGAFGPGGDPNGGDGGAGSTSPLNPGGDAPTAPPNGPGYGGGGGGGGGGHSGIEAATAGGAGAAGGFGAGAGGDGGTGTETGGEGGGGGGGGGGAGLGGAIFVEQGGSLTYRPGLVTGSAVVGGNGGNGGNGNAGGAGGNGGSAHGAGIFIQGNNTIILSPIGGADVLKIFDEITDETGSSGTPLGVGNVVIGGDPLATDGGTVHLVGTHTYTGTTTVREGILVLGDQESSGALGHIDNSAVTVESGGRLAGNGSTGAVTVLDGGTLAPGESAGQITVTNLTLSAGAEFLVEIGGTLPGPGGFDQVVVDGGAIDGAVNLGSADLKVLVPGPSVPSFGSTFTIIDNDKTDAVNGTFNGLQDESNFQSTDGRTFSIDYQGGDGNDVVLRLLGIAIVKKTNGTDNNTPPGPALEVGSTATFTYEVTNTTGSEGNDGFALANVIVEDDNGTPGNGADDFNPDFVGGDTDNDQFLDVDETWIYTKAHTVTEGQYTNIATVTADVAPTSPSGTITILAAEGFSDTDPDNHIGVVTAPPGCQEFFIGTPGPDTLVGDECDNTMLGFAGDDSLSGAGGNDTLLGDAGNDTLNGNDGNDRLFGGAGVDVLQGENGDDYLDGGADQDLLLGQAGDDQLLGRGGNDRLDGGDGNDQIFGGDGNDLMLGRAGNDSLDGGNGNDRGIGGDGNDILQGRAGNDTLDGDDGNDQLFGGDDFDILRGGAGQDRLDGGNGNDRLFGGTGNDVLLGRDGNDRLEGGLGVDQLFGGLDVDTFVFNDTAETGVTTASADRIHDFSFADGDRIRLAAIDADVTVAGDQAFDFIGSAAFSAAGQIRFFTTGSETRILLNTDSDSAAEAMIRVGGVHTPVDGWFIK